MYIKIDGRRFDINFSVFETVIIGTPFLKRHKAVISFDDRNCITIKLNMLQKITSIPMTLENAL